MVSPMSVFSFDIQEPFIKCPNCGLEFVARLEQKSIFSYCRCSECKTHLRPDYKTRVRILFCGGIAMGLVLAILFGVVPFPSRDEALTWSQVIWFGIGFSLLALLAIMKKHTAWEPNPKVKSANNNEHDSVFNDDNSKFKTH